ncbi:exonuclease domain-containing protein [Microbacterium sp. LRZ72]|uniref:exonuclease domain-containing protein n=1 Tax=Microbacterium sp. LRZ72 TaxID=2942481 RepID=UPI0029AD00CF|nr:exonuclease domain-containing protein [Microbacterium sp. LRZ72]MDX2375791.1 exonuclease domain-containing protein [Microbacterium sp. LRZ72]
MPLDFTAIDFETANASPASACAVGLVRVRDARVVARASWLIRPPAGHDEFSPFNTRIHGIRARDVADAATWSEQLDRLCAFAGADVLVAHNAGFDMNVLRRACDTTGDTCPPHRYLCSVQLARKTYRLDSYRLPLVAAAAGCADFVHHDAAADAEACARIVIDAARRHTASDVPTLVDASGIRLSHLAAAPVTARTPRAARVA